jgi:TonB family protein
VKLLDVRPQYQARRRQAGVSAKVSLEGRIGSDGFMKDLHLAAPAAGVFAGAALDAASAWRFAPTRLGGVPVETPIRITFDFQAK